MKRRIKKNQKGSVLLTVICFTTVCMLLASTALSLANYSSKVSNNNIRSTQAEITAQNYLQEFISAFEKVDPAGGVTYSDLSDIAGVDEAHAKEYTATLASSGASSENVGDCKIYVYNTTGGIVVKSEATYAGQTEVASAFFEAESTPFSSTNAIEVSNGMETSGNSITVEGNVMAEGDVSETYEYNNSSVFKGNFYTQSNLETKTSSQKFSDGVDGKALTVTALGYIKFNNSPTIQSGIGTRTKDVITGDYLNKNGYIYAGNKVIFSTEGGPSIGTSTDPIDVYSHGVVFGKFPDSVNEGLNTIDLSSEKAAIDATVGVDGFSNEYDKMYGNIYCYKGSNLTYQDGNLIINSGKITINGDIFVEGNIYLTQNTTLEAKNIYCEGNIYDYKGNKWTSGGTTFNGSIIGTVTLGSGAIDRTIQRNVMPDSDYDPSKFDASDSTKQNPKRSSTSIYANATPNDMFCANTPEAKYIQTKYDDAYKTKIDTTYIYDSTKTPKENIKANVEDWADYFYVDEACTKPLSSVLEECTDNNDWNNSQKNKYKTLYVKDNIYIPSNGWGGMNIKDRIWGDYETSLYGDNDLKIVVKVKDHDVVVILPESMTYQFHLSVDFTDCIDPITNLPKYFCYFMVDGGAASDVNNYYKNNVDINTHEWKFSEVTILDNFTVTVDNIKNSLKKENFIFYLVPNNFKINLDRSTLKGIIYGPKADLLASKGRSDYVLYGQAMVNSVTCNQNGTKIAGLLAGENSILDFINSSATSAVKLQYFTKYKS